MGQTIRRFPSGIGSPVVPLSLRERVRVRASSESVLLFCDVCTTLLSPTATPLQEGEGRPAMHAACNYRLLTESFRCLGNAEVK
jgi:hypothetical protein